MTKTKEIATVKTTQKILAYLYLILSYTIILSKQKRPVSALLKNSLGSQALAADMQT